ncbi:hypothetical protein LTR56_018285 [Elasticomyces elasticus]|nr:hypothetical protein LTR56_018285 [Elasticomyces elasticus]KAK3636775.1 hypothetical protein LTR22_018590 [Elasticomyces elasticus]KAK4912361.1 hypothetical protein LTR49_019179 [Elasticomyces elasticus]KAK5751844.1 hypothetical protein LTS12_018085 [Elasticomyces elasticus]
MSQDLFAEFALPAVPVRGINTNAEIRQASASSPVVGSHLLGVETNATDEDDDFGDFEDASKAISDIEPAPVVALAKTSIARGSYPPVKPTPAPTKGLPFKPREVTADVGSHPFANHMDLLFAADDDEYDAGADEIADLATNPEAAMAYSKRVIAAQQAEELSSRSPAPSRPSATIAQKQEPIKLPKKSGYVPTRDAEVLFDVEDDAQDDFGDFEAGSSAVDNNNIHVPRTELPATGRSALREQSSYVAPEPEEEAWDDFETSTAPSDFEATPQRYADAPEDSPFRRTTTAIAAKAPIHTSASSLPPTNVPPPAALLSIFPSIFTSGQEALLDPLSKLDLKQRQVLLAHPATHLFLRGYLGLAIVLGHIIAGRKLRWKRDQYLAQGMRIGPAGGKTGMKLAGIDKSEVAKEDREVLDTVRLWKTQVGKLRSAASAANANTPDGDGRLPAVPEISQAIPIRTLKAAEGGMTAPHPCALCGLKREERVAKVDVEVNDSFGEWWVEGMSMHLLCRNFWEQQKSKLRSR